MTPTEWLAGLYQNDRDRWRSVRHQMCEDLLDDIIYGCSRWTTHAAEILYNVLNDMMDDELVEIYQEEIGNPIETCG